LHLLDADVIFLQEVQGKHDFHAVKHENWPEQAQHDFLAGDSHHSVYGMNAVYQHGHHGNALLSRFAIKHWQNRDVSDHAYEQRGILHTILHTPALDVHCFVVHLGLFAGSRRRQVQMLIDDVKKIIPPEAALIIAGDFNDWQIDLSQHLYQELGVMEVFDTKHHHVAHDQIHRKKVQHGRTFPARFPCLCLDRMYVRGFQIAQAEVLAGSPWNKLSDHVPILAQLQLPLPKPTTDTQNQNYA